MKAVDIYYEMLSNDRSGRGTWVLCSTQEEVNCFKDWVLSLRPDTYTTYAKLSAKPPMAFTYLNTPWYERAGVIDSIERPDFKDKHRRFITFEDWYLIAYPWDEDTNCDFSDLI